MNYPKSVKIVEVGPRDGLQNEAKELTVETKVQLIRYLADAGLKNIEAGSFVSPKWVPQMAGSDQVFKDIIANIQPVYTDTVFSALTPNEIGLNRAVDCGVKEVAVFTAASESFSQKNINCSIKESLERFRPVIEYANSLNIAVRGYVSCALGCPYDGDVSPKKVSQLTQQLLKMGCYEVSLADTTGVGTSASTHTMLSEVISSIPVEKLAVHMHDTFGQALANILISLQMGISVIDTAVAGLGGCPFAKNATGNVSTEDVIYMLNGLGLHHGVDLDKIISAGNFISLALGQNSSSKVSRALSH